MKDKKEIFVRVIKILSFAAKFFCCIFLYMWIQQICGIFLARQTENMVFYSVSSAPFGCLIVGFLSFYSLVRYSILFDNEIRGSYIKKHETINTIKEKISFVWGFRQFRIVTLIVAILLVITPFDLWCPLLNTVELKVLGTLLSKVLLLPLVFVLLSLIAYIAIKSAMSFWEGDLFLPKNKRFNYGLSSYLGKMATLILAYTMGTVIFMIVFDQVLTTVVLNVKKFNVNSIINITNVVVLFGVIPFLIKLFASLLKRRKFFSRLKRVCKEHDCSLSKIKRPYASLFKQKREANFDFELDGVKYAVRMLRAKNRYTPIFMYESGQGAYVTIVKFSKVELFRFYSWFDFSFDAAPDVKKLLVINPVPQRIFVEFEGRDVLIDNNDRVGEYKIFSGTALVNSIDRHCLHK